MVSRTSKCAGVESIWACAALKVKNVSSPNKENQSWKKYVFSWLK